MERICEPELMDEPAQARAYADADFSTSDRAVVERLMELFGTEEGGGEPPAGLGPRIVDLGCGPGNITFLRAAMFPEGTVVGIDGAAAMLAIAEERRRALADAAPGTWAEASRAARLRFQQAILPLRDEQAHSLRVQASGEDGEGDGEDATAGFSAVVSNSLLHHLHDPRVLWRTVRQLADPGAAVYLQDLRRPASAAEAELLVASEMAAAPEVLQRDYRHSLLAAFTAPEVEAQLRDSGLEGLQVQERGGRYLEVWGRLPLTATCGA
jgi:SAM-dependent methyltransferase